MMRIWGGIIRSRLKSWDILSFNILWKQNNLNSLSVTRSATYDWIILVGNAWFDRFVKLTWAMNWFSSFRPTMVLSKRWRHPGCWSPTHGSAAVPFVATRPRRRRHRRRRRRSIATSIGRRRATTTTTTTPMKTRRRKSRWTMTRNNNGKKRKNRCGYLILT